jgi:hypothetical protein
MYRACSTWQYEVAAHLVEEHGGGHRLGYMAGGEYTALLRQDHEKAKVDSEKKRGGRVIKAHEGERSMAAELAAGRASAVYAYRDVRDVVFSLMHKRGKTFEQILRQGMIHQILANDRFWMAQPHLLVQRYEDLLAHPAAGVKELASHLGFALAEGEAQRVADQYSQDSNRARTEALRQRLEEAGVDLQSSGNAQICDPSSLLHWNHMRQRGAGSWQTSATPRQIASLHRLCGRWLKSHGYSLEGGPARKWALSIRALQELLQAEVDLLVGLANFLIRSISLRFPNTARGAKQLLGLSTETSAGATVWADPIPTRQPQSATSDAA